MSDLIYRQAVIDGLGMGKEFLSRALAETDVVGHEREKYEWGLGLIESYIADLKELPSAESEPHWIPCSERLPEEEKKTYWVYTDTGYQCECRWTNNRFGMGDGKWGWSIFDTPQYTKPIAWMPLPEPYKGEE